MNHQVSDAELHQLSVFLEARMGLHFPKDRWPDLARGIHSAMRDFTLEESAASVESLLTSPLTKRRIEILASHLTIGETYFFRERKAFEALEERILPELVRLRQSGDRRIRIWSAGCCTGEEAYSIAITISRSVPDWKDWNITVLATDINPRFLQKAQEGIYGDWSFRDVAPDLKERYFSRTKNGRFEILPSIKSMVEFSHVNLADDVYPSLLNNTNAMDVIFCRNVLMYFTSQRTTKVIQNLYRSLVDGGWLIVSPTEASHVLYSQFTTVNFPDAILYKKESNAPSKVHTEDLFLLPQADEGNVQSSPQFKFPPEQKVDDFFTRGPSEIVAAEVEKNQNRGSDPKTYVEVLALYERGFYPEAEESIVRLLSQDRDDARLMALLARVYANQGKLVEAQEWSQRANAADKLNPAYRYLLATIMQERGLEDDAMTSLKQALYLDQNFVLAYFALGNLVQRQGKANEAQKHFQNALALLGSYRNEDILPESEGVTAGRLAEIIGSITNG